MKKNKKIIILLILVCLLSGCTKTLKDKDKKAVVNEKTGQNLTENIFVFPALMLRPLSLSFAFFCEGGHLSRIL